MPEPTNTKRLAELEKQVIDLKLAAIHKAVNELELRAEVDDKRIRALETTATKVDTIIWLVMGGGLLSAINLYLVFAK